MSWKSHEYSYLRLLMMKSSLVKSEIIHSWSLDMNEQTWQEETQNNNTELKRRNHKIKGKNWCKWVISNKKNIQNHPQRKRN